MPLPFFVLFIAVSVYLVVAPRRFVTGMRLSRPPAPRDYRLLVFAVRAMGVLFLAVALTKIFTSSP
ncbi:MAG: hypothetical protein JWQ11_1166 [Rhizobacter sp.]|nr:hypothetical protein [Rhizobacter sp.]